MQRRTAGPGGGGADGLQGVRMWKLFGVFDFDLYGTVAYAYSLAVLFVAFIAIPKPEKSALVGQDSFFSDLKNGCRYSEIFFEFACDIFRRADSISAYRYSN